MQFGVGRWRNVLALAMCGVVAGLAIQQPARALADEDVDLPRVVVAAGPTMGYLFGYYSFANKSSLGIAGSVGVKAWGRVYGVGRYAYEDLPSYNKVDVNPSYVANNWSAGLRYYVRNDNYSSTHNTVLFFTEAMLGYSALRRPASQPIGPILHGPNGRIGIGATFKVHRYLALGTSAGYLLGLLNEQQDIGALQIFDATAFLQLQF
ncbi:MAG: hypothetical protein KBG15_14535 [Kofleriaceae bacterium]|nr:hypothetical protein [Kofleriaceae bacterium]